MTYIRPVRRPLTLRCATVAGLVAALAAVALAPVAAQTPLPPPVLGSAVNVTPVEGRVLVSLPGATTQPGSSVPGIRGRTFVPLRQAAQLPVRTIVDTRGAAVRLDSARDGAGAINSGRFSSGAFEVRQSADPAARGLTELRLRGGNFAGCPGRGARASRTSRRRVRRLRSSVRRGSRFKDSARHVSGTVRGTVWETVDRCDTSITGVSEGAVAVRDFRRRKTIRVRRGQDYIACAPGFKLDPSQASGSRDARLAQSIRRLRSPTRGRFRTCGRYSAATVRGG